MVRLTCTGRLLDRAWGSHWRLHLARRAGGSGFASEHLLMNGHVAYCLHTAQHRPSGRAPLTLSLISVSASRKRYRAHGPVGLIAVRPGGTDPARRQICSATCRTQ